MANRHFPDRVELVVRPVASMEPDESSSKKGPGQAEENGAKRRVSGKHIGDPVR